MLKNRRLARGQFYVLMRLAQYIEDKTNINITFNIVNYILEMNKNKI